MFGFPTHKYKAKHDHNVLQKSQQTNFRIQEQPTDFLRKLFLREKQSARHSSSADKGNRDRSRRSGSGYVPRRSSTLPIPSSTDSPVHSFSTLPSPIHTRESTQDSQTDATSAASSRRVPLSPASTLRMRPHAPRMQTEPTSLKKYTDVQPIPIPLSEHRSTAHAASLPKALVISGLEYVEIPAQRVLLRVLQDRKVVLDNDSVFGMQSVDFYPSFDRTWELPLDFMMVYVCALDQHERPPVLETLVSNSARCRPRLN